jgi:hypothetical protein
MKRRAQFLGTELKLFEALVEATKLAAELILLARGVAPFPRLSHEGKALGSANSSTSTYYFFYRGARFNRQACVGDASTRHECLGTLELFLVTIHVTRAVALSAQLLPFIIAVRWHPTYAGARGYRDQPAQAAV